MGQGVSTILTHPLTGTAVQLLFNWLRTLPSTPQKVFGEHILLQTLRELGFDQIHLRQIMPKQEKYIKKIEEMEETISILEEKLSSEYRASLASVKRDIEQKFTENYKIEKYFHESPASNVKIPDDFKTMAKEAANKNGVDNENYYNFAFVGHVNNGKSSLINAIFGLNTNDPGAAPVGIHETTQKIRFYSNDCMPNIRFYDIPGAGTMTHRSKSYYNDKALCGFDCLIILVQQALCEEEIEFARAAREFYQEVVFVRSKCDIDFYLNHESGNILSTPPTTDAVENHIAELRHKLNCELQEHAPELNTIDCFFVSANSMRAIIRTEPTDMVFEETKFLEYLYQKSKAARGLSLF